MACTKEFPTNPDNNQPWCWSTYSPMHLIDGSPSPLRPNHRRRRRRSGPLPGRRTSSLRRASRREGSCGTRAVCCEGSFGTGSFPPVALELSKNTHGFCSTPFHDRRLHERPTGARSFSRTVAAAGIYRAARQLRMYAGEKGLDNDVFQERSEAYRKRARTGNV